MLAYELIPFNGNITVELQGRVKVDIPVQSVSFSEVITQSDFISLHTPFADQPILGAAEFAEMKNGCLLYTSRCV